MGGGRERDFDAMAATATAAGAPDAALDATAAAASAPATEPMQTGARRLDRGQSLGPFLVLDQLGAGGMGVVFSAYDARLDRRVAVKLLRTELASPAARVRLLREAQAMARLAHPNVVTVFEVGTLGDDVFIAMEHVGAGTLGSWLRARPRTWREIVAAFREAGRGLAAAHGAGLVHRDFKPDNVLVGDDGRFRVTDFGLVGRADDATPAASPAPVPAPAIAPRALDASTPLSAALTEAGAVMGTPIYMAPEQHLGAAVDHRADQFGFCVALYEALWQQRPFAGNNLVELTHSVVTGELREPPRKEVPAAIRAAVMRGLARDPAARFPSLDALLAELGTRDRPGRRLALIAAPVIAAVAAVGFVALRRGAAAPCRDFDAHLAGTWDARVRGELRARFTASGAPSADAAFTTTAASLDGWRTRWLDARRDACEANRVRGEQSDAIQSLRDACLDAKLGEARALTTALAQPLDRATVERAAQAASALPSLADCADVPLLTEAGAVPLPIDARAREPFLQGQVSRASVEQALDHRAMAMWLGAQVLADPHVKQIPSVRAAALNLLASLANTHGDIATSRTDSGAAIEAAALAHRPDLEVDAWRLMLFAIGANAADVEQARALVPAMRAAASRAGDDARIRAAVDETEGLLAYQASDLVTAQARYEDSLAHADGDGTRIVATQNLGNVEYRRGDYARAADRFGQALALRLHAYGPRTFEVAQSIGALASVARIRDRPFDALVLGLTALAIDEQTLGHDAAPVALTLDNLGNAANDAGRLDDARAYLEEGLAIRGRILGTDNPEYALSLNNLGAFYAQTLHDNARGREYFARSRAIYEAKLGADTLDVADASFALGSIAHDTNDLVTAKRELARAAAIFDAHHAHTPRAVASHEVMGEVMLETGDDAGAVREEELAAAGYLAIDDGSSAGDALSYAARAQAHAGALDDAAATAARALATVEKAVGADTSASYTSLLAIATVAMARGRTADAAGAMQRAVAHGDGVADIYAGAGELLYARALAPTDRKRAAALATSAAAHLRAAVRTAAAADATALARTLGAR